MARIAMAASEAVQTALRRTDSSALDGVLLPHLRLEPGLEEPQRQEDGIIILTLARLQKVVVSQVSSKLYVPYIV